MAILDKYCNFEAILTSDISANSMKTNQNSMSTGISYLIAVVIYGTALTNADQDRKRGLISMLLQVIIDLDHGNSRKSIRASSYYTSLAVGKFWCREKSKSMLRFESRANTEATTKLVLLIVIKVATSSSGTVAWVIFKVVVVSGKRQNFA